MERRSRCSRTRRAARMGTRSSRFHHRRVPRARRHATWSSYSTSRARCRAGRWSRGARRAAGGRMEQARGGGRALLQTLTSADRFRVIDFSSDVRAFRDGWAAATSANVREALAYLDALRANGGTNIQAALEEALRGGAPDGG